MPLELVDALASAVAKGWLLELIDAAPLEAADAVPAGPISAEGPLLAEAMLRALASDAELERLDHEGDLEPLAAAVVRLSGVADGGGAVRAVELLREVLVSALVPAHVHPEDAAAIVERAALVAATVAAAAAGAIAPAEANAPPARPAKGGRRPKLATPADIVEPAPAAAAPIDLGAVRARLSAPAVDTSGGEGARPLWVVALERQAAAGGRFALVLVEVDGAEKLKASSGEAMFARVGRSLRDEVRRADLIAHEPDGRAWVVSPDCGRAGAEALAQRLAVAVERVAAPRGAALTASIGISYFPDDGRDADRLIEVAEEQMFAARAAGVRVIEVSEGDAGGDDERSGPRAAG